MIGIRPLVQRRFGRASARHVASTVTVNLSTTLVASAGGVLLARNLGPTDRGSLVVIVLWPAVVAMFASVGVLQATCYWISRRPDEGIAIMQRAVRVAVLTGTVIGVVGYFTAPLLGRTDSVTTMLRIVLAFSPAFIGGGVWISSLQAVDIRLWNRSRVVQPMLYFACILGLVISGSLTLRSATAVVCGSVVIQAWYARHLTASAVSGARPAPNGAVRMLYSYGVKVWLSAIPRLVNFRLDQLVLSVIPSVAPAELGVYAVAASLAWLALPAATAFGAVAFPAVARSTSELRTRRIERLALAGSAGAAAVVLALVCLMAPVVVPRLFGSDFREAVVYLWLLAPGSVFLALNGVLDNLLQGRGRPLSTSVGEGVGAVLTIVLLVVLTPRFGIRGAATASSVAYFGSTVILWSRLRAARAFPVEHRANQLSPPASPNDPDMQSPSQ